MLASCSTPLGTTLPAARTASAATEPVELLTTSDFSTSREEACAVCTPNIATATTARNRFALFIVRSCSEFAPQRALHVRQGSLHSTGRVPRRVHPGVW